MDDTPIKKPDAEFKLEQRILRERLEAGQGDTTPMKNGLELRFQQTFSFEKIKETEFTYQCIRHLEKFIPELIDHARSYRMNQHPGLTLILSQPYVRVDGVMEDYADTALGPLGIQSLDLTEWTFHYPGKTSVIGLIVSRKSLHAMKMVLASDQETVQGMRNFWDF